MIFSKRDKSIFMDSEILIDWGIQLLMATMQPPFHLKPLYLGREMKKYKNEFLKISFYSTTHMCIYTVGTVSHIIIILEIVINFFNTIFFSYHVLEKLPSCVL